MNISEEFDKLALFTECENGWTRVNNHDIAKIKQFIKEKIKETQLSLLEDFFHCEGISEAKRNELLHKAYNLEKAEIETRITN